uniref:Uncharacterized protein LOC116946041 isoform X3 n=1 Tax=Petromyzon marinus TaxID=7757 RepID=A0AAJ7X0G8_PETMA|nr:uncharacterized protein LOC116946041 isoform X3 [Petromyzon marinus]
MGGTCRLALLTALGFALAFIQGSPHVAGQSLAVVNCTGVNVTELGNALLGVNITAAQLENFTAEEFACLNDSTLSLIPADQLAQLYMSKFLNSTIVSRSVTLNLRNLTLLGNVLDGINKTISADVRTVMMTTIWDTLKPSLATLSDAEGTKWFQTRLVPFLPSITAVEIADIPINVSCVNFITMSQSLSGVYGTISKDIQLAALNKINNFLVADVTMMNKNCTQNINSSTLLNTYFGKFSALANYSDFEVSPAFKGAEVLNLLTPAQLADYAAKPNVQNNATLLSAIFLNINGIDNMATFVDRFDVVANKSFEAPAQAAVMAGVWTKLGPSLAAMPDADVSTWFNQRLSPLILPGITAEMVANITTGLNCTAFASISQSLSGVYGTISKDIQLAALNKINNFLVADVTMMNKNCTQNINSSTLLNTYFGKFSALANYSDFEVFPAFKGAEVLNLLSPAQLADYAAKPNVQNNATLLSAIFPNINGIDNMATFVDRFDVVANKSFEAPARAVVMAGVWTKLGPSLSAMPDADVSTWFNQRLSPLILPGITAGMVGNISTGLNCTAFTSISQSLSGVYGTISKDTQLAALNKINNFLVADVTMMNKNCTQNINSSTLLNTYFGKFSALANYSDFEVFPAFKGAEVLNLLSPAQLADYAAKPNVQNNVTLLSAIFPNINSIDNMATFVDRFDVVANKSFEAPARAVVMASVWTKLGPSLAAMPDADVSTWFNQRLSPLILPGITAEMVANITTGLNCTAFASISQSLSGVYGTISKDIQLAALNKINNFLVADVTMMNKNCTQNINSSTLLNTYFGKFSALANYSDFEVFPAFKGAEVLNLLSPAQLADYAAKPNVQNNATLLSAIFPNINGIDNMATFVDRFNVVANKSFEAPAQAAVMAGVWTKLGPSLAAMPDADVSTWFNQRLSPLILPGITPDILATFPTQFNCTVFASIVGSLDSVSISNESKVSTYKWIIKYLSSNGSSHRCFTPGNTTTQWLDSSLRGFKSNLILPDFLSILNNNASIVPANELLALLNVTTFSNYSGAMTQLFDNYSPIDVLLEAYNKNFSTSYNSLNGAVKSAVVTSAFGRFGKELKLSPNNVTSTRWFSTYMPMFLPDVNKDALALVSLSDCSIYASAVDPFKNIYPKLTLDNRIAVHDWLVANLNSTNASRPPCFVGKNSWLTDNLQQYFLLTNKAELEMLVTNNSQLVEFLIHQSTLDQLANANNLTTDMMNYLVQQMHAGKINLTSVPNPLLCSYVVAYSSELTADNSNVLLGNLTACEVSLPNTKDKDKLHVIIVSKLTNYTSDVIKSLGGAVVAVPFSDIDKKFTSGMVLDTLPQLGSQSGWSLGQTRKLLMKLGDQYAVNSSKSLEGLGTLVSGVSSDTFKRMDADQLKNYMINSNMSVNIQTLPPGIQSVIVSKLLVDKNMTIEYINRLPPSTVTQIPPESLRSLTNKSLSIFSKGQWTDSQAVILLDELKDNNIASIITTAPNLLPGFSCGQLKASDNVKDFLNTVTTVKGQLTGSQESCLAEKLLNTADESVPSTVLMLLPASRQNFGVNCQKVFTKMGKGNINKVPMDKTRTNLLTNALSCLHISKENLTADSIAVLGNLSCMLSDNQIKNADSSILMHLSQCRVYTDAQATSIQEKLIVFYKNSSTWTSQTLTEMGDMVTTLNNTTLYAINQSQLTPLKDYVAALSQATYTGPARLNFSPNVTLINLRLAALINGGGGGGGGGRRKRGAPDTCPLGTPLTRTSIVDQGPLLVLMSAANLNACLPLDVFSQSIEDLGKVKFLPDQLAVLKGKLNTAFPTPVPQDVLLILGTLALGFTPDELRQLNLSSIDTVAKLAQTPGWSTDQIKAVASNYESTNNVPQLTSSDLKSLGVFVSGLSDVGQINNDAYKAAAESIGNVATYSPDQLTKLWSKANSSFSGFPAGSITQIGSVVAGASAADINNLGESQIGEIKPLAIPLIPLSVFKGLNVMTVNSLSRDSALSISNSQYNQLSIAAQAALAQRLASFVAYTAPNAPGSGYVEVPSPPAGGAQSLSATAMTLVAVLLLPSLGLLLA